MLKPDALLINTARGGLVDLGALEAALHAGRLGGAGLDVLEHEPDVHARLMRDPRVIITPHVAYYSAEGAVEMRNVAKAAGKGDVVDATPYVL